MTFNIFPIQSLQKFMTKGVNILILSWALQYLKNETDACQLSNNSISCHILTLIILK